MLKHDFSMPAAELAQLLARQAEAVCRHYLPAGRREGRYWLVGNVHNTPGRSLFVRLGGGSTGKGAAGRQQDLLDLIRERCGLTEFRDVADEARRLQGMEGDEQIAAASMPEVDDGGDAVLDAAHTQRAARRLVGMAQSLWGTLGEIYLRWRGITAEALTGIAALRFHPHCFYRATPDAQPEPWPALIAAVTDLEGDITGIQRTWLDPDGFDPIDTVRLGKAPLDAPRRALGLLRGHAVRFGTRAGAKTGPENGLLVAGEGIETVLSLRCALPAMPMAAALSAGHLAAIHLPAGLRRLYIGKWTAVHARFQRWSRAGVWEALFHALADTPDFEYVLIDSTISKVHADAVGAKGGLRLPPLAAHAGG